MANQKVLKPVSIPASARTPWSPSLLRCFCVPATLGTSIEGLSLQTTGGGHSMSGAAHPRTLGTLSAPLGPCAKPGPLGAQPLWGPLLKAEPEEGRRGRTFLSGAAHHRTFGTVRAPGTPRTAGTTGSPSLLRTSIEGLSLRAARAGHTVSLAAHHRAACPTAETSHLGACVLRVHHRAIGRSLKAHRAWCVCVLRLGLRLLCLRSKRCPGTCGDNHRNYKCQFFHNINFHSS